MPSLGDNIQIPAIGEITDITNMRIVLLQSGRFVSAPLASVANAIIKAALQETGSFTPVLKFGGATTGITYSTQTGSYIAIGSLVFVSVNITLTSKGTATGTATIEGLPF